MIWAALVSVLGLVGLLASERTGSSARFLAKPLASAGFIGVAVAAGALDSGFGRWMVAALVLSALGDVFLLGSSEATFLGGLGSFLTAHLVYGIAFLVRGVAAPGLLATAPFAVFARQVLRWLRPHLSDRMRGPVVAYAVVISIMGVMAVGTAVEVWDWRIPTGAIMFVISDLAVARDKFVEPDVSNRLWGLPLYYGGQLLLAWAAGG